MSEDSREIGSKAICDRPPSFITVHPLSPHAPRITARTVSPSFGRTRRELAATTSRSRRKARPTRPSLVCGSIGSYSSEPTVGCACLGICEGRGTGRVTAGQPIPAMMRYGSRRGPIRCPPKGTPARSFIPPRAGSGRRLGLVPSRPHWLGLELLPTASRTAEPHPETPDDYRRRKAVQLQVRKFRDNDRRRVGGAIKGSAKEGAWVAQLPVPVLTEFRGSR